MQALENTVTTNEAPAQMTLVQVPVDADTMAKVRERDIDMSLGQIATDDETLPRYKFYRQEIKDLLNDQHMTEDRMQAVANILAANVEATDSTQPLNLERANFNDGFSDMMEDLRQDYGRY